MKKINNSMPDVPDHVPDDLVWDNSLDVFIHDLDDPFRAAARLHDGPHIFWARDASYGRPGWVIVRHALIKEAYIDYERFSSQNTLDLPRMLGVSWKLIPIECDPPEHTPYRRLLNPFFTPRAMSELDAEVREVCNSLMSKFENHGSCEFISEFAIPFPSYIFLALIGLPIEEASQFLSWEHAMFRGADNAERVVAGKAVVQYLEDFMNVQRRTPQTDLIKGIVRGQIDGRPLSDDEVMGILFTAYLGGLDSVYSSLGWVMRHLALDDPLQQRLRTRPQDIPMAVGELLRAYSVISNHRIAAKDFVFHGVEMRKGDHVILPTYLAGRDPQAYEEPHRIDLNRQGVGLTFGSGSHMCLGRHLAQREIRIVLESFLTKFAKIHIPPGEPYAYHTRGVIGIDRLPLAWERIG